MTTPEQREAQKRIGHVWLVTVKVPLEIWQWMSHRKVDGYGTLNDQIREALAEYKERHDGT